MALDFAYGINTENRFFNLLGHDEDPDEFIANQTQPGEKPKKPSKEAKPVTSTSTKRTTTPATTTTSATTTKPASSNTTKTNKENLTEKPTHTDQRRQQQQPHVFADNDNQQTRIDSGRGGRGFSRRGGSAGQDRNVHEGGYRGGGGQQRPQRFHKFEGPQEPRDETSGFEQIGDNWKIEPGHENQNFRGYRGRGRGGPRRGNFEGGRGRGRGGRGYFHNRPHEEGAQEQQPTQEISAWEQSATSNFDNTHPQSARTAGRELDTEVPSQEEPFQSDTNRRGGRGQGHYRPRVFRSSRNYGGDRQNYNEGGEGGHDHYRENRRQYDRQPRSYVSGVKPIEKKDGEGAHNWGNETENPEEQPVSTDVNDPAAETTAAASKDWAKQVDEAEKQMTLDEYKKKIEAKKQAQQEKVPQLHRREAGEGVDLKEWQKYTHLYKKKHEDGETDEEVEGESGGEEHESEEEHAGGKKKIITIPLQFKPIESPRGPGDSRGGQRRGVGRYRDQQRSKSPNQQQVSLPQQAGEYHNDEQQQQQQPQQPRPYRGGSRQGSGRGEYRRPYGNSARGAYNRPHVDSNTPDLANTFDFPTLPKQ